MSLNPFVYLARVLRIAPIFYRSSVKYNAHLTNLTSYHHHRRTDATYRCRRAYVHLAVRDFFSLHSSYRSSFSRERASFNVVPHTVVVYRSLPSELTEILAGDKSDNDRYVSLITRTYIVTKTRGGATVSRRVRRAFCCLFFESNCHGESSDSQLSPTYTKVKVSPRLIRLTRRVSYQCSCAFASYHTRCMQSRRRICS